MLFDHDNAAPHNLILVLIVGEIENLDFFKKEKPNKIKCRHFFQKEMVYELKRIDVYSEH